MLYGVTSVALQMKLLEILQILNRQLRMFWILDDFSPQSAKNRPIASVLP